MRLIDADDMLNMVDLLNDRAYSKKEIAAMINTRSTAYDIDKVVEELGKKLLEKKYQHENEDYYVGICEAIEIVKQGVR